MIMGLRAGSAGDGVSFVDWNGAVTFFSFFSLPVFSSYFDRRFENQHSDNTNVFISIVYCFDLLRSKLARDVTNVDGGKETPWCAVLWLNFQSFFSK